MLDALGVEWVEAKDLPNLPNSSTVSSQAHQLSADDQIYACQIPPSAYFERKTDGGYDRSEYYAKPDLYKSTFDEKVSFSGHYPDGQANIRSRPISQL